MKGEWTLYQWGGSPVEGRSNQADTEKSTRKKTA